MQRALAEASTTERDKGSNPEEYSESLAPSGKATHVSYAVHSLEDVLVRVLFISPKSRGRWKKKSQDNKKTS